MARKRDVVARVGADTGEFDRNIKKSSSDLDKFAEVGRKAGALLATGIAAATTAIVAFTARGLVAAKSLDDITRRLGATSDGLQTLRHMTRQTGASIGLMDASLERATRRVGEFHSSGGGPAAKWIERLGFDVNELARLRPEDLFQRYGEAIRGLNTRGEQLAALSALMGDESRALINVIDQGADAFGEAEAQVHKLGLTLDRTQQQNIQRANVALDNMKAAAEGVSLQLAANFAPAIEAAVKLLSTLITWLGNTVIRMDDFARRVLGLRREVQEASTEALQRELADIDREIETARVQAERLEKAAARAMTREERMELGPITPALLDQSIEALFARQAEIHAELAKRDEELNQERLDSLSDLLAGEGTLRQTAADEQTALEEMLYSLFEDIQQRRLDAETLANEQRLEEMRRLAAEQTEIEETLFDLFADIKAREVAEFEAAERAKRAMVEFSHTHTLSKLVSAGAALSQHSRKMFELNKHAATAQTIVDGIASAKAAFKNAGGYPWGIPAAIADAADTAARVSAIQRTTFGSGTTPSVAATPTVNDMPVEPQRRQTIFVEGITDDALFSGQMVRGLMGRLQEAIDDGGTLVFGP